MEHFLNLSYDELVEALIQNGIPKFRAKQIFCMIYEKYQLDLTSNKNNLDSKTVDFIKNNYLLSSFTKANENHASNEQTIKYLWKLSDGLFVESVLIYAPERRTLCVSCQVGCPVGCLFCASGRKGLLRNLSTGEILEQIVQVNRILADKQESPLSHIVFMGMGEPLLNLEAVRKAIIQITDPQGFNISARRVTLSTVGITDKIYALGEEKLKINLALSLHGATQKTREKLVPLAKKYPLPELLKALDAYFDNTSRDITFEYTLVEGVNDSVEDAKDLVALMRNRQGSVNVIPYNPVEGLEWTRPSKEAIGLFLSILRRAHVPVSCRYTKGDDIAAACGQLALMS